MHFEKLKPSCGHMFMYNWLHFICLLGLSPSLKASRLNPCPTNPVGGWQYSFLATFLTTSHVITIVGDKHTVKGLFFIFYFLIFNGYIMVGFETDHKPTLEKKSNNKEDSL